MKLKCYIVEDLMPEYLEDICSQETKEDIQEHLQECGDCRKKLEEIQGEDKEFEQSLPIGSEDIQPFKKIGKELKKNRIKKVVAIVLLVVVCAVFGVLTVGQVFPRVSCPSYDSIMYRFKAKKIAQDFVDGKVKDVLRGTASENWDMSNSGDTHYAFLGDVTEHIQKSHEKIFGNKEAEIRIESVLYEDRYGVENEHSEPCYKVKLVIKVKNRDIFMGISFDDKYTYRVSLWTGEQTETYLNPAIRDENSLEYMAQDMSRYFSYYYECCIGYSMPRELVNLRISLQNHETVKEDAERDGGFLSYYFVEDCTKENVTSEEEYSVKVGNKIYDILGKCKSNDFQMANKEYNAEEKKYNATLYWQLVDLNGKNGVMSKEFYYGAGGYEPVDDRETFFGDVDFDEEMIKDLEKVFD